MSSSPIALDLSGPSGTIYLYESVKVDWVDRNQSVTNIQMFGQFLVSWYISLIFMRTNVDHNFDHRHTSGPNKPQLSKLSIEERFNTVSHSPQFPAQIS